jgi:RimJ/RimL family protein N-acetyltransferase
MTPGTTYLPIRLRETDSPALIEHFLALVAGDRRLRFGASLSDDAIRSLEERIDFDRDEIFGIPADDLRLLAVVHVAFYPDMAELGLSALPEARGKGLGTALFARATMHIANRGVRRVFVHCLSENSAMMHLARRNGMEIVREGGEADGWLSLPRATPGTVLSEWVWDHNARFAHEMRRFSRDAVTVIAGMRPDLRR